MAYVLSNSHVTDDVTWPPKVLCGSTVGYPSDSLASCYIRHKTKAIQVSILSYLLIVVRCLVLVQDYSPIK